MEISRCNKNENKVALRKCSDQMAPGSKDVTVHTQTAYLKGPHKQYLYSLIAVIKDQEIKNMNFACTFFFRYDLNFP